MFLLFNVGFWWHVKNIQTEQLKIPYEKGFKSIIDDNIENLFYDVNTDDGFVDWNIKKSTIKWKSTQSYFFRTDLLIYGNEKYTGIKIAVYIQTKWLKSYSQND